MWNFNNKTDKLNFSYSSDMFEIWVYIWDFCETIKNKLKKIISKK